jgi:hypothetical protein
MTNDKGHPSPAEASREGLRELDEHKHHGTTAHTSPPHPSGPKFDETPSEVHRGTHVAEKK